MANKIHHIVPVPQTPRVRLLEAGSGRIDAEWCSIDVIRAFFRVYLNDRSGAQVVVNNRVHRIKPGYLHLIPAWTRFDCQCHQSTHHRYLHFEVVGLPADQSRRWIGKSLGFKQPPWAVQAWRGNGAAREMRLMAIMSWLLACVIDRQGAAPTMDLSRRSRFASALTLIDQQLHHKLTVNDLAEVCALSEGQFSREFKQAMGVSPGQFLIERRVSHVARLLMDTDLSLEQIAEQSGFADRFHMSRVFTKRMEVPPATYRRTQKTIR